LPAKLDGQEIGDCRIADAGKKGCAGLETGENLAKNGGPLTTHKIGIVPLIELITLLRHRNFEITQIRPFVKAL